MKPNGIQAGKRICGWGIFILLLILNASAYGEMIPAARRIQWNPGVRGDIPARPTIFANVKNAPYNAVGDGVSDDTTAIKNALAACPAGQAVYLPAGTYKISSPILLKDGITLRGAGMGTTTVAGAAGFSGAYLVGILDTSYDYAFLNSTARNITGGLAKDSTTITTAVAHGWNVGDFIMIDQLSDPAGDPTVSSLGTNSGGCGWCGRGDGARPLGQWSKVVAVPSATTATIDPPLHWGYSATATPQGIKLNRVRQNSGVESLTLDNSASAAKDTVHMTWAVNCWLYQVEMIGSNRRMVEVSGGLWNTIRGCKLHEGTPATPTTGTQYGSDRAYGIFLGLWDPTACLVENNDLYHLSFGISLEGAPSGNVISYNYFTDFYYIDTNWQRVAIGHHGAHPMMNLIEGNMTNGLSIEADNYWGTASHTTIFRNRVTNTTRSCGPWAIDLIQKVRYFNIVGNVIGSATDNSYELDNVSYSYCNGTASARAIYKFGYTDGGDHDALGNDPLVKGTVLRHGNYDFVTNAVNWDSGITDHNLPSSLYLTGKPAWWGNLGWPIIGPDLAPMYPASSGKPWGNAVSKPPPSTLRVQ